MDTPTYRYDYELQSPFKALFLEVRSMLLALPDVKEIKTPNLTSYHLPEGCICSMRSDAKRLIISFSKGAKLAETFPLASQGQKVVRHLYLTQINEPERALLNALFERSIALIFEHHAARSMRQCPPKPPQA